MLKNSHSQIGQGSQNEKPKYRLKRHPFKNAWLVLGKHLPGWPEVREVVKVIYDKKTPDISRLTKSFNYSHGNISLNDL